MMDATFRAIAETVVPGARSLDEKGWADLDAIIAQALAMRPPRMIRQLRVLVRLIGILALMRFGKPFRNLDLERRTRVLAALENGRVKLLRRGFWGLRTLVLMGYYARPAAAAEVGYRASPEGWAARA